MMDLIPLPHDAAAYEDSKRWLFSMIAKKKPLY
jgi:hypothetical protein